MIDTLLRRDYVWKKGTALVPSWTAFAKLQLLERHFAHLIDYEFTATMEEALDVIARGEGEAEKWLHTFYFGNGVAGLKELVDEEHLATIDPAEVNAVPSARTTSARDDHRARLEQRREPRDRRREGAGARSTSRPTSSPSRRPRSSSRRARAGHAVLGTDPDTGLPVLALTGRYGPFVQLGELEDGAKEKPKRASLLEMQDVNEIGLEDALKLLALPRVVGSDAEGNEITAQNGRYGPYLKKGTDSRSLEAEEQLFTVTLAEAEALFAQPKQRGRRTQAADRRPRAAPRARQARCVCSTAGSGPYVTDGTINATVPRGVDPAEIDLEQARRAAPRARGARPGRRSAPAKEEGAAQEDDEAGRQEGHVEDVARGKARQGEEGDEGAAADSTRGRRRRKRTSLYPERRRER